VRRFEAEILAASDDAKGYGPFGTHWSERLFGKSAISFRTRSLQGRRDPADAGDAVQKQVQAERGEA
jgi:hypothetical protein